MLLKMHYTHLTKALNSKITTTTTKSAVQPFLAIFSSSITEGNLKRYEPKKINKIA